MPKRPSLVGTAREAIGKAPAARPKPPPVSAEPPVKQTRKAKRSALPQPAPATRPEAKAPLERERTATSQTSAYEAMMSFASATLRQNLETGARLARCKSPMEALAAQTAHAAALTQNLFAVSLKLMQLGFSSASWTTLRPELPPDAP